MAHDPTRSWPTGKGPNDTNIPGAAWLELLDGQAFPVVGSGAMVWNGTMWVPVSTQNRLPVDAAVSGTVDVSDRADRQLGKVALTGQITATKSVSRFATLAASTEEVLAEVPREAIVHAILIKYDRDDPGARAMMDIWDGSQFQVLLMSHSPSSHSGRITPSDVAYNGLFEVLVNNHPNYVVRLREQMHVAGFRLRVSNTLQQNIQIAASVVWSEV